MHDHLVRQQVGRRGAGGRVGVVAEVIGQGVRKPPVDDRELPVAAPLDLRPDGFVALVRLDVGEFLFLDQALDLVRAIGQLLESALLGFPGFSG
ncbi:hypothetical protein [Streptomyces atratus]|uniref:hypothetical protein n=1 Tax=Streptomyces atratus TaxID=1893 RepID=UPI00225AF31E|nr:hypothetical protein [Streptomyces atratus]MCX5346002.1 hypothetical protein [Streptomyces atratus]